MDIIHLLAAFELLCFVLSFGGQADGESGNKGLRLYPDIFTRGSEQSVAANAMDGRTNIGESNVGNGVLNCASTKDPRRVQRLRYLEIDLWGRHAISAIRLHLRDGEFRRRWQTGLVVRVSNHTIDDNNGDPGKQCGSNYTATQEQSPLFSCWTSGRYIYAILHNSRYALQVCEVQIFTGMDLTGPGVASLYPKTLFQQGNVKALASKAVDGKSSIGNSGAVGGANCAVTSLFRGAPPRRLQYLRLDLDRNHTIHSIRLHLRDGGRYRSQNDMYVQISSSLRLASGHHCGLPYNSSNGGQSPVFVCNKTGNIVWMILWNKTTPIQICEVEVYADIICMKPANPGNGKYYVTRPSVGGVLWLQCNRDFDATANVTCGSSGNWSGPVPTCQPSSRCKYKDPANGQATPIRDNKGVLTGVEYSCNRGYELSGSRIRQCARNGQLSGSVSVCRIVDCRPPLPLQHGYTEGSVFTYESAVTYNCNRGYRLVGEDKKRTVCQDNGKWKPSKPPSCEEVLCPDLSKSRITNGIVLFDDNHVDSIVTYRCRRGYTVVGNVTRACQQDATWSGDKPTCQRRKCSHLNHPNNGIVTLTNSVKFESVADYTCNKSYELRDGQESRTCLSTGKWSGNEPTCHHVCESQTCSAGRECTTDDNGKLSWACPDPSQCPSDFSSVCGTDGVTYNNECLMKAKTCAEDKTGIKVAAQGYCRYGGVCNEGKPAPKGDPPCRPSYPRYWFNSTSNKCERYYSGGCYEGRNSFYTEQGCQETCITANVCRLPFDAGKCNYAPITSSRSFFNSTSRVCEQFTYSGCFGNENNFFDKDTCNRKCCVCQSLQTRKQVNAEREAVLLIQINSMRTTRNGKAFYKARVLSVCIAKPGRPRKINSQDEQDTAKIFVNEKVNDEGCLCPKLSKGVTYRVGVEVTGKSGSTWDLEVPKKFYVKEATNC